MVTIHGMMFKQFDLFWHNLRQFFYHHKTLFDMLFLMLYATEQIIFFTLISLSPENFQVIITFFIIVFISTIGFERICMGSRYHFLRENLVRVTAAYGKEAAEADLLRSSTGDELSRKEKLFKSTEQYSNYEEVL